jgi:hypothetical protein
MYSSTTVCLFFLLLSSYMIQQCYLLQGAYTKISLKRVELNSLQQTHICCNLNSADFDLNYIYEYVYV